MRVLLIVLLTIFIIWIVFILGPALTFYMMMFCRKKPLSYLNVVPEKAYFAGHEDHYHEVHDRLLAIPGKRISMEAGDGTRLECDYLKNKGKKAAILLHGFRSDPYINFAGMGTILWDMGYDLYLVYARGHGDSKGSYTMGVKEQEDLLQWVDFIKKDYLPEKIVVGGISMGAVTTAYVSDRLEGVNALIIDCGGESPYEQLCSEMRKRHLPWRLLIPVIRICGMLHLKKDIKIPVSTSLSQTTIPTIFIHGQADQTISAELGIRNYESCASKKELILVPDAPHTAALTVGGDTARTAFENFIINCEN